MTRDGGWTVDGEQCERETVAMLMKFAIIPFSPLTAKRRLAAIYGGWAPNTLTPIT